VRKSFPLSLYFYFKPFYLSYSFTLEGSLFPGTYSSLTEHSLATVPVALGKNRAYSHCACFPLEIFHPVYIILYMAPSHATTSCKNISSYTQTMSGPFNDWIQDHQQITYDSVDCLPVVDFGGVGPAQRRELFCLFGGDTQKSSFLPCSFHTFFAAFHNDKNISFGVPAKLQHH